MLFNSLEFVVFLIPVLALYAVLPHRKQNLMLLAASYMFYGAWDYRFLSLLFASTVADYFIGLRLGAETDKRRRKRLLLTSIGINLSMLGFFKYFGFFTQSMADFAGMFGVELSPVTLNIVLPVGISFYTFQTLSYTFDIYRRQLEPERRFTDFALFVAFFPQLVAGPIERAKRLLPQITAPRNVTPEKIGMGVYLILLGLFKKVVVADNLAPIVDRIFNQGNVTGVEVLIAAIAFGFQIYCDFSGYSDIARGLARLLGFELVLNFRQPFFAKNPSDFWSRWHVSFTSYMRDYVFISLGGSRGGKLLTIRNLVVTSVLAGLWHGAAWNFALWGIYFSAVIVAYHLYEKGIKIHVDRALSGAAWAARPRAVLAIGAMIAVNLYAFIMFRSTSVAQILDMTIALGHFGSLAPLAAFGTKFAVLAGPIILLDYYEYRADRQELPTYAPVWAQSVAYTAAIASFVVMGAFDGTSFIYFQF